MVESTAGPAHFSYEQVGPDDSSGDTSGTVSPAAAGSTNIAVKGDLERESTTGETPRPVDLTGTVTVNPPPAKPDELFKKGDLVILRIPNKHDYYNISMILTSGTGLTFVNETTEKAGK